MYAVIDLYGQCAQVSIVGSVQSNTRAPYAISENSQSLQAASVIAPLTEVKHRYAKRIKMLTSYSIAIFTICLFYFSLFIKDGHVYREV